MNQSEGVWHIFFSNFVSFFFTNLDGEKEDNGEVHENYMIESTRPAEQAGQRVKLSSRISVC
jgi:hypothetical protein